MHTKMLATTMVLLLAGCGGGAGIATAVDFDPSADFGSYGSYAWVSQPEDDMDEPINGYIRAAVDRELQAKGLRKVGDGPADAAVGYRVAINTSTTQEMVNRGWSGGYRSTTGYSGGGAGVAQRDVEHVAGTLFLFVFDGQSKEAVWTGIGNGTVDPDLSDESRRERIGAAVAEILEAYPPG